MPGAFSTHTALDRNAHARKRRVMSHAFSDAALRGVEDYVLVHVREYVEKLSKTMRGVSNGYLSDANKGWTETKDVSKWSSYLGFDVMGDLCFGKAFGMLGEHPENREAVHLLCQAARRHNIVNALSLP